MVAKLLVFSLPTCLDYLSKPGVGQSLDGSLSKNQFPHHLVMLMRLTYWLVSVSSTDTHCSRCLEKLFHHPLLLLCHHHPPPEIAISFLFKFIRLPLN